MIKISELSFSNDMFRCRGGVETLLRAGIKPAPARNKNKNPLTL
jgi:hypothetical protein